MNKKTIIYGLLLLIGFSVLVWSGRPKDGAPVSTFGAEGGEKSALFSDRVVHDFGTISMSDGKVETMFTVTNQTVSDITVENMVTSCMCTVAYFVKDGVEKGPFGMPGHGIQVVKANEVIEAGESRGIRVVFDPKAHGPAGVGLIDRSILLADVDGKLLELRIKARVTP